MPTNLHVQFYKAEVDGARGQQTQQTHVRGAAFEERDLIEIQYILFVKCTM